jgi:hypothetical protein
METQFAAPPQADGPGNVDVQREAVLCQVIAAAVAQAHQDGTNLRTASVDAAMAFNDGLEAFEQAQSTVLAYKNFERPADMNVYTTDNYPRAGCTVVIELAEKTWRWLVYAPGFAPGGSEGIIESLFSRPHGSTGIAIDAFIRHGSNMRPFTAAMARAERDYATSSGSTVTL